MHPVKVLKHIYSNVFAIHQVQLALFAGGFTISLFIRLKVAAMGDWRSQMVVYVFTSLTQLSIARWTIIHTRELEMTTGN